VFLLSSFQRTVSTLHSSRFARLEFATAKSGITLPSNFDFLRDNQVFKALNYYIKEKTMTDKKVLRLTETVAGSG